MTSGEELEKDIDELYGQPEEEEDEEDEDENGKDEECSGQE
jgi:hypothetical protein